MQQHEVARLEALNFDPALGLYDCFARVCAIIPDHPALVSGDRALSYAETARAAGAIAVALIAAGVAPGDRVAIVSSRAIEVQLAMLGILRAGAAYVPLDPGYAREQIAFILSDAAPAAILCPGALRDLVVPLAGPGVPVLDIDDCIARPVPDDQVWPQATGRDVGYVIYTSGSTGRPKGVVVAQRAIARIGFDQPLGQVLPGDVSLHSSTIACDGACQEFWPALLVGGTVAIVAVAKPSLDDLVAAITRHRVTVALFYTGVFHLLAEHRPEAFSGMRLVFAGGDVVAPGHARRVKDLYPDLCLCNLYGPTEGTVFCTTHQITAADLQGGPLPIGRPEAHTDCFVLDEALQDLGPGQVGQLALAGIGVADGYLNLPDQTAQRFVPDPRPGHVGRVYLTGDLVRQRADGVFEFLGRVDRQVKIGGRRIELDEVEHVMRKLPGLANAAVEVIAPAGADRRIAAFVKPAGAMPGDERAFVRDLMAQLNAVLPEGMLPRFTMVLPDLPLTNANKIDRKTLVALAQTRLASEAGAGPAPDAGDMGPARMTAIITEIWQQILGPGPISPEATFFEAGGTSLQLMRAHAALESWLGLRFDITLLFETARLRDLALRLADLAAQAPKAAAGAVAAPARAARPDLPPGAIAIIGLSGRFPGADGLDQFWRHIRAGDNLIPRFRPDEIEDSYTPDQRAAPNYVPARPWLPDAEMFDAPFFGMYPREAAVADPQGRVFLEVAYEALEDAGHDPRRFDGGIGVFAGASLSTYLLHNLLADRAASDDLTSGFQVGNYNELTGNVTDSVATRVAYKLGLTGPAFSIGTACSTSLTAIAQAVVNLRARACDMAIAGGVSITFPQRRGYFCLEGGMVSPDGVCRPFDKDAGGTVFGHGAGAVVLRRLEDALADGDQIYAVIRGVGINNDGADKIAYTAPSVTGQSRAIRMAYADAGYGPETVSYVECHGTATPLGDPIELRSLTLAFGPGQGPGSCAIGSVKGNIGHLDAAAGVMGVIKTALMFRHGEIPVVANFRALNPKIDLSDAPFRVPERTEAWASAGPRRAGVSSFGVGGTNVHLTLEEPPPRLDPPRPDTVQILPLAAKSPEALAAMHDRLATALAAADAPALCDVAFTLQEGRAAYPWRSAIAARDLAGAVAALRKAPAVRRPAPDAAPAVALMFPGQGSQYPGMGSGLYRSEPEFARWIDQGAEILEPILGLNLNSLLCFAEPSDVDAARALRDTRLTQPTLFLTQYACAQLWLARGVRPAAMIGHSVGEFAAAALSGVMDFETGLRIIAARGQLMQDQPGGAMLSVRASLDDLAPHLDGSVDLAARNAPQLNVLAGSHEAIAAMADRLQAAGLACSTLHTSHAFHSRMMDQVCDALARQIAGVTLHAPQIPWVSCVSGTWITEAEARDPAYWAGQARRAVNFADAIATLAASRPTVLLETGAGGVLSAFAAQALTRDGHAGIVQSLPDHTRPVSDEEAMARAFGRLWALGVAVDWARAGPRGARRVSLPAYPFQRKRHWVDPPAASAHPVALVQADAQPLAVTESPAMTMTSAPAAANPAPRKPRLVAELLAMLSDLSGEDLAPEDAGASFLELGFDSLFLGQFTQRLASVYKTSLTFRQLLSDYPSAEALADHLDQTLPPEVAAPAPALAPGVPAPALAQTAPVAVAPLPPPATGLAQVVQAQMQTMQAIFAQQLAALGAAPGAQAALPAPASLAAPSRQLAPAAADPTPADAPAPARQGFAIGRATNAGGGDLTPAQLTFARDLAQAYSARFPKSKAYTQRYRPALADPRTVAGFRAEWKEMVFPVVADRSKGSRLWDIDGNEFIDFVNGFGQTAFGHSPDFVIEAINRQMARGFAIGPQSDLAGPLAERLTSFLGHDRVTFCNTGSEAVMAAMRLARAVTGRDRIVVFGNDYHGQFDEVLVKGKGRGGVPAALPIAPGIPRSGLGNMVVLPYGAPESLDWLRANASEIAAVIVEPVQSRHPELRPAEFVRALRALTQDSGAALVMDEVVTGFRVGPRGMQGEWGIEADMATYGKVVGGGMPIGLLAGKRRFMDALDGGEWAFGDASGPQTAPTFFAGTFVRHPLVLAAVGATLDHIEAQGDDLWRRVAARTGQLVDEMNAHLAARGLPRAVEGYSSWFIMNLTDLDPNATLIFPLMRMKGVHVQVGYAGMGTTAHSEADFRACAEAFAQSLDDLRAVGILADQGGAAAVSAPPAAPVAPRRDIPLTEAQREIWMTSQLSDEASCSFNESASLVLQGDLDVAALERALARVIARHDGLRQRFARTGATFDILDPFPPALPLQDISGVPDPQDALRALLARDAATPIDLVQGPPLRMMLVRRGPRDHVLVVTAHHIVCDGWSYNVVFTDLAALYTEETGGPAADLPPAPSFAAHAAASASTRPRAETIDHWRRVYADLPDLPALPTDRPRGAVKSYAGATVTAQIPEGVMRGARKAGAKQGCTLFTTLFAAVQTVISRLSGSDDVVLGVPTGGQALLPNPDLVGHCVNFLPIRAPIDRRAPMAQHLARVRDAVMAAFDHQDCTYGTLVRELGIERSLGRLPLTEVQFNLEKLAEGMAMGGLQVSTHANPKTAVNFDLFFNVVERRDGLRVDVDYNSDLYDEATVLRWLGHLETLLAEMAADADRPVGTIPLLRQSETDWLAEGLNATAAPIPDGTLHGLIDAVARAMPDRIAIEDAGGQMRYADLLARADAVAAAVQRLLPAPGGRVAVSVARGADCVAAMLGVLKAGHAYVPLDPLQPPARLAAVIGAARADVVIHDGAGAPDPAAGRPCIALADLALGARPAPVVDDPAATAYVIFTSGSTGVPKGVEIGHRAVVNLLQSMLREPGLGRDDVMLAVTTTSFDIAALELFGPLLCGARVVIAPAEDVLDGFRLVARLAQGDITHMQATPTLWMMLLEAGLTPHPGLTMWCGGEPLPADLAGRLLAGGGALWNLYGPTETTIWSAVDRVAPDGRISIGHPIANTELHVLGPLDELVPPGAVGELNIGGAGLARGYFDRPDLTAEAFREVVVNGRARRLYRSGDLARRLADGRIELLGRQDGQIKLRGFRIELGEVEAALRAIDGIAAAAVALRPAPQGGDLLVGYLVRDRDHADPVDPAPILAAQLPGYMVPTAWVSLSDLPKTANGKLDRKALPAPEAQAVVTPLRTPAATPTEQALAAIWQEVLGLDEISTTDTLYALGADSLTVFRIAARMIDAGLNLEARDLLRHPTIRDLAAHADARGTDDPGPARPSLRAFRGGARRNAV
ncbi:non-ribosomal peptide synthetase/type I polyketide synthase [Phaeovulum sp. NW3]|uniref:non-ribosomal peptide synthetase/type I polyketide synthase n=1 Tax=Phaeovulum sp. NW3 TaxID=2934933 RepID=UPI002020C692|nr:non-ribosomal peptide synthetase/type I polyketide synthase [Phaeovulum sp. NW3]MCL7464699.1 amino acid adenylation domain-containing protein [Phaeovulum sp. NW3]